MVCCGSCITIVTTPILCCPPLPQDEQEVEPAFELLKSMAAIGRAAVDNLSLPPPLFHAAGDAVVLGTALEKFIGGFYNTQLPPTVAMENIAEARYIIYLIEHRCQPFRDCCYLHFVCTVQAFLVIAAFLQWLAKKVRGVQKFFACVCVWQPEGRGRLLPCEDSGVRPPLLGG